MTQPKKGQFRTILAWCLYDFANSPFTTLVVTFIYSTYFTKYFFEDSTYGTVLWSRAVTVTAITVALLSPVMGTLADRGGYRKLFLFLFTTVAVVGTFILSTIPPGFVMTALCCFAVANIAYEMGCVFYNAFLPDIAPPRRIGRISGYGWALGYVGGLLALSIAFVGFVLPETPWFGFDKESGDHLRATNILVALWFALFSIPIFLWVKEDKSRVSPSTENVIKASWRQLSRTFSEIKQYREIIKMLLARLFYNDGLITIFIFSGIYAKETYNFSDTELLILAISLNVAAGLGAFALGFIDDVLGGKRTIQLSLVGLTVATLFAIFGTSNIHLWIGGLLAGIFSGPNQSASRSLMGRFVPPDKENEFFGFFAFSGKATAFLGPLSFGLLTQWFQTQRAGVAVVLVFFALGALILYFVDEKEGARMAGREQEG